MADLLKIVERAATTNILLVEEHLARTQIGDAGAVDSTAPPVAGGAL